MALTAQKLQYGSPKMPVLGRAFAKPINWLFSKFSFLVTVVLPVFDCILNVYRDSLYTFNIQTNISNTTVTNKLYRAWIVIL